MRGANAGPPDVGWVFVPPSGKLVEFKVPEDGKDVQVTYFGGHYHLLEVVGFADALFALITYHRKHRFAGGQESRYFRFRMKCGVRFRVLVIFTDDSIEITELEAAQSALSA